MMSNDVLDKVGKRLGDLSDLPEALRKQINTGKMGDIEEKNPQDDETTLRRNRDD